MTGPDGSYWIKLFDADENYLGAGLSLNALFVLTANHCVRDVSPHSRLFVSTASGRRVPATLMERAQGCDVALLMVDDRYGMDAFPPTMATCLPEDRWSSPFRPSDSDVHLSGSVVAVGSPYLHADGTMTPALQLLTYVDLGDYSGYSGAPVEGSNDVGGRQLLGMLLEQYPHRVDAGRASNVLIACAMADALRSLRSMDLAHLAQAFDPAHDMAPAASTNADKTAQLVEQGSQLLAAIGEWAEMFSAEQLTELRLNVVRKVIDRVL